MVGTIGNKTKRFGAEVTDTKRLLRRPLFILVSTLKSPSGRKQPFEFSLHPLLVTEQRAKEGHTTLVFLGARFSPIA
ncbi:MAG TPA: hypothetical protein ENJ90_07925 [Devosia sp.]|nr:hypothetical protein [Devosia sp.]